MKKQTIVLILTVFISGTMFFSFANVAFLAKEKGAQAVTHTVDWKTYKKEQEEKIAANEKRIAELKKEKANEDKKLAEEYNKKIEKLEQKNIELKNKIATYKYEETKWEQFKREFSHDMDELGKALKDIGKDNVK